MEVAIVCFWKIFVTLLAVLTEMVFDALKA